jgi:hypothetical protein
MSAGEPAPELDSYARQVNDSVNQAAESTGIASVVREYPYAAVGAAFGVGFVLAGGLFSPATRRLVGLGLKVAMLPQVHGKLLDVAEAALDGMLEKAKQSAK